MCGNTDDPAKVWETSTGLPVWAVLLINICIDLKYNTFGKRLASPYGQLLISCDSCALHSNVKWHVHQLMRRERSLSQFGCVISRDPMHLLHVPFERGVVSKALATNWTRTGVPPHMNTAFMSYHIARMIEHFPADVAVVMHAPWGWNCSSLTEWSSRTRGYTSH